MNLLYALLATHLNYCTTSRNNVYLCLALWKPPNFGETGCSVFKLNQSIYISEGIKNALMIGCSAKLNMDTRIVPGFVYRFVSYIIAHR